MSSEKLEQTQQSMQLDSRGTFEGVISQTKIILSHS